MTGPVVPAYGSGTLAELLPSVAAHFGVSGAVDRLGVGRAERYVVLLIDGLGWEQRGWWDGVAPFLGELASTGRTITSGVPSTTATSITSLGTGLTPGEHGIAGYSFYYPPIKRVLNSLRWEPGVNGLDVQPRLTYFERLGSVGVHTSTVCPARFKGSGLTTVALRGPSFLGVADEQDHPRRIELARDAAVSADRTVVYVYERSLDHAGHGSGVGSPEWLAALRRCDSLAQGLWEALPSGVRLVITGDHGMVNVPSSQRLLVEEEPELLRNVTAFAGEGRFRQLYTTTDSREAVAGRWQDRLGERAWVLTRDEAFEAGWFGPRDSRNAARFGDVLVAMQGCGAVMTATLPKELTLVGMHGSLTAAEVLVPLLIV